IIDIKIPRTVDLLGDHHRNRLARITSLDHCNSSLYGPAITRSWLSKVRRRGGRDVTGYGHVANSGRKSMARTTDAQLAQAVVESCSIQTQACRRAGGTADHPVTVAQYT